MEESRLYRSHSNSVIGGVCGGLGEYMNVDPVLFRVLFVIAFLVGGSGFLIYVLMWIVIPLEEPPIIKTYKNSDMEEEIKQEEVKQEKTEQKKKPQRGDGNLWGGLILITLGAIFLIERFVPRINFDDLWPLLLVVVGVILISRSFPKSK